MFRARRARDELCAPGAGYGGERSAILCGPFPGRARARRFASAPSLSPSLRPSSRPSFAAARVERSRPAARDASAPVVLEPLRLSRFFVAAGRDGQNESPGFYPGAPSKFKQTKEKT